MATPGTFQHDAVAPARLAQPIATGFCAALPLILGSRAVLCCVRVGTTYPQPHDIAIQVVVTETVPHQPKES